LSVARVKAEYYIVFVIGIFLVALGIYGAYTAVIEILAGYPSKLILASIGIIILGSLMTRLTYQMFIPLKKKNNYNAIRVCPFCGALVEKNATVCEKCKRQVD
jgi:divalent metal cation (Fe/Co/Zn/Cd) transporter